MSASAVTSLKDRLRGAPPAAPERRPQPAPVEQTEAAPARAPEATPRPASHPGELTVDYLAEIWMRVRADVKAVNRRAEALLSNVDPIDVKGTSITLGSTYEFHGKKLNEDENRRLIEDAIQRIIGKTVTVITVAREGYVASTAPVPAASAPVAARDDERERIEAERDEQRIQAAKNIFDGEVVS